MQKDIGPFLTGFIGFIAVWNAHVAGAAYVLAERSGKPKRAAITRTIISVALILSAVWLGR